MKRTSIPHMDHYQTSTKVTPHCSCPSRSYCAFFFGSAHFVNTIFFSVHTVPFLLLKSHLLVNSISIPVCFFYVSLCSFFFPLQAPPTFFSLYASHSVWKIKKKKMFEKKRIKNFHFPKFSCSHFFLYCYCKFEIMFFKQILSGNN